MIVSRHPRAWSLVALTVATLLVLLGALVAQVGRPYPGIFVTPALRAFASSPAAIAPEWGDRIVSVDGRSPVALEKRVASDGPPIRYEIERDGRRVALDLAPQPFNLRLLLGHFGVFFAVSTIMLGCREPRAPLPAAVSRT